MQQRHSTVLKALAGLSFGVALTATSAQAQAEACVLNEGGYFAKMAVWIGTTQHTELSDSYSKNYWRCQSLGGVPDGKFYYVKVRAVGGGLATCEHRTAQQRSAALTSKIYFIATETTFYPVCQFTDRRP